MSVDVVLRAVTDDDVTVFYDHQRDPEATELTGFAARDRDDHERHWARIRGAPDVVTRTVVSRGDVVGNIVSWVQDGQREVGYWIDRAHWGHGIASRALALFLAEGDVRRPLVAHVAAHNVGSIRVLETCGFEVSTEDSDDGEVVMVLG
jgi:RimJ/RimL family protein N-acetyltransferase